MFELIKKILEFVWLRKRSLLFFLLAVFLFFVIRFPWNDLAEKVVKNIQKNQPASLRTDFESLSFHFFPPGLEFKNVSLSYKNRSLDLDSLRASIALSRWAALKKAWSFSAAQGASSLFFEFWQKEKIIEDGLEKTPISVYFLKGSSPNFQIEALSGLFSNIKASGRLRAQFDYEGSLEEIEKAKAFLNLSGKDILFSQTELQTPLGPLSLPLLSWKKADIAARLKEGELILRKFQIGAPSDDLNLEMKGSGAVGFSYGNLQLNSYNIQLQVDVKKSFPVNLLDLFFAGFKEDKGSFYRYRLRMIGQGNKVPVMEKLDEFN